MAGKIPKITVLVCVTTMVVIVNVRCSFCFDQTGRAVFEDDVTVNVNDSRPGFKPVPEAYQRIKSEWGLPAQKGIKRMSDNHPYRKWCEETFANGKDIYNAYKEIAFNIKYTPEQEKTDFWQTPCETARMKRGDCEDAVFLFFSQIPPEQKCAEIVWGWVIERKSMVAKAHVWYQLKDKKGIEYVVEGFSRDWNGIIPLEALERNEIRKPIFVIAHATIGSLINSLQKAANFQKNKSEMDFFEETSIERQETTAQPFSQEWATLFSLSDNNLFEGVINMQHKSRISTRHQRFFDTRNLGLNMKEISNILTKLHDVLSRYLNQKNAIGTEVKVVTQERRSGHFSLEKNFICKR